MARYDVLLLQELFTKVSEAGSDLTDAQYVEYLCTAQGFSYNEHDLSRRLSIGTISSAYGDEVTACTIALEGSPPRLCLYMDTYAEFDCDMTQILLNWRITSYSRHSHLTDYMELKNLRFLVTQLLVFNFLESKGFKIHEESIKLLRSRIERSNLLGVL